MDLYFFPGFIQPLNHPLKIKFEPRNACSASKIPRQLVNHDNKKLNIYYEFQKKSNAPTPNPPTQPLSEEKITFKPLL